MLQDSENNALTVNIMKRNVTEMKEKKDEIDIRQDLQEICSTVLTLLGFLTIKHTIHSMHTEIVCHVLNVDCSVSCYPLSCLIHKPSWLNLLTARVQACFRLDQWSFQVYE